MSFGGRLGVFGLAVALLSAQLVSARSAQSATRQAKAKTGAKATATSKEKRPAKRGKVPRAGKTTARSGEGGTWLLKKPANVIPNQQGNVVIFPFRNDDENLVSNQVRQLLGARGLEVMTDVRRMDTAEQYRDVATHLHLVAYVDGEVRGTEAKTRVTVRLRNGYSGRNVTQATFRESRSDLPRAISEKLWTKLGPAMARACKDAEKPRRRSRHTLEINAGTPLDPAPRPAAEAAGGIN
jgi:hypothetical protein